MSPVVVVERRTRLAAESAAVWRRVCTPEGIRHELGPVLRMTMPPGLAGRTIDEVAPLIGRPLGRAWLLLGVLPVEYDDMTLVAVEPGRSFHERSRMLTLRRWEHERAVLPDAAGCVVVDRLTFEPRVGALAPVARRIVGALFAHRHRRLAAWFAPAPGEARARP